VASAHAETLNVVGPMKNLTADGGEWKAFGTTEIDSRLPWEIPVEPTHIAVPKEHTETDSFLKAMEGDLATAKACCSTQCDVLCRDFLNLPCCAVRWKLDCVVAKCSLGGGANFCLV
jgi:hypothetical protein